MTTDEFWKVLAGARGKAKCIRSGRIRIYADGHCDCPVTYVANKVKPLPGALWEPINANCAGASLGMDCDVIDQIIEAADHETPVDPTLRARLCEVLGLEE